ncbi:N-acetylmuramoyl-L-alanine amidase [Mucilaginibacter calamicampi]|uniref:N-acetylmuramoyl-L-alanine amidase n=1 Tax=Mucilaginibacter calamicampi TaxID=1302352 RepID=A0ABW2Z036_9SPHI
MNIRKLSITAAFLSFAAFSIYLTLSSFTQQTKLPQAETTFKFKTIVIDAGHGGKDPGAHGSSASEKTVALAIAKKLRDAIKEQMPGIDVVMTRSDDTFIELNRRSEIANKANGNLFISIHCNSSPEKPGRRKGVMLLVYGMHRVSEQVEAIRENAAIYQEKDYQEKYKKYDASDPINRIVLNAYLQKYRKYSILFGDLLNKAFKGDGRESIGVKEQGVLVLAHSAMPAVLVETGFINHPEEEKYLASAEGQNEIAQGILRAVKNYKASVSSQ